MRLSRSILVVAVASTALGSPVHAQHEKTPAMVLGGIVMAFAVASVCDLRADEERAALATSGARLVDQLGVSGPEMFRLRAEAVAIARQGDCDVLRGQFAALVRDLQTQARRVLPPLR